MAGRDGAIRGSRADPREGDGARGDRATSGGYLPFNFVEAADLPDDPHAGLAHVAGPRRGRKLERPATGDAGGDGTLRAARTRRSRGESTGLRQDLDENDSGHDGIAREMSLEIKIG